MNKNTEISTWKIYIGESSWNSSCTFLVVLLFVDRRFEIFHIFFIIFPSLHMPALTSKKNVRLIEHLSSENIEGSGVDGMEWNETFIDLSKSLSHFRLSVWLWIRNINIFIHISPATINYARARVDSVMREREEKRGKAAKGSAWCSLSFLLLTSL